MLNVVALNGRLTDDPELRHTQNDTPVTSFTLAVDRNYVNDSGERQADFIDVVCWRGTAEFACKYFKKGQLVAVEGSLQTRIYEDSHGNKCKAVEVLASHVHFAEPKRSSADNRQSAQAEAYSSGNNNDFVEIDVDDDLPF